MMGPEVGAKDDVVVERPSLSCVDGSVNEISQGETIPDGVVSVAIVRVIDDAVKGVMCVANQQALMSFPDA